MESDNALRRRSETISKWSRVLLVVVFSIWLIIAQHFRSALSLPVDDRFKRKPTAMVDTYMVQRRII